MKVGWHRYGEGEIVTVVEYDDFRRVHICQFADGLKLAVDLMIAGTISPNAGSLIGKKVSVDYLHPYISIAADPHIVEEALLDGTPEQTEEGTHDKV